MKSLVIPLFAGVKLEWSTPFLYDLLAQRGFPLRGFRVFVDGVDAALVHPANNFTATARKWQNVQGLRAASSYNFSIEARLSSPQPCLSVRLLHS